MSASAARMSTSLPLPRFAYESELANVAKGFEVELREVSERGRKAGEKSGKFNSNYCR